MYRIFIFGTTILLHEEADFNKAVRYAELYKKNIGKGCTIQKCETIWSSETLDDLLKED